MKAIILKEGSKAHNYAWTFIEEHPLNKCLDVPHEANNNGNTWLYMGTIEHKDIAISTFKHEQHPLTQKMEQIAVKHLETLSDEDIEVSKSIR